MKILVFCVCMSLVLPVVSDARCRTVGESASLGSEYGTFPLYPAERLVATGQKRDSVAMQWAGYGIGLPLFVVAMPFAMVGAVAGAVAHPWTTCEGDRGASRVARRSPLMGEDVNSRDRYLVWRRVVFLPGMAVPPVVLDWLRNLAGGRPNSRLNARLKEGSDS